jgi:addiction module HigA family antidote
LASVDDPVVQVQGHRGHLGGAVEPEISGGDPGAMEQQLHNPHPGEILKEEFLAGIGMSQNQLAHAIGVPGNRIHAIVNGTRDISADTDLRLCKFFGLSEGYFLRLQNAYDTLEAKRRIAEQVAKIKPYEVADR